MVFAAFSPDHIAVMLSAVRGQFYTVLEYKTRVVDDTQQCEQSLADTYGALASVQLVTNAFDRTFKDIVRKEATGAEYFTMSSAVVFATGFLCTLHLHELSGSFTCMSGILSLLRTEQRYISFARRT